MKYGLPLFTTALSGKLGGIVGATARGGVGYFRRRVDPSNPQSPAQLVVRSITAGLAAGWTALTNAQRTAWEGIAGAESSGIDAYVKGNFQLAMGGDAIVSNAPASLALPDPQLFEDVTLSNTTGGGEDQVGIELVAISGYGVNVYVSAPQSESRGARQYPFRYAGTLENGDTELAFPADHPAANTLDGQVVYVRMVEYNATGQVANEQTFRLTAAFV